MHDQPETILRIRNDQGLNDKKRSTKRRLKRSNAIHKILRANNITMIAIKLCNMYLLRLHSILQTASAFPAIHTCIFQLLALVGCVTIQRYVPFKKIILRAPIIGPLFCSCSELWMYYRAFNYSDCFAWRHSVLKSQSRARTVGKCDDLKKHRFDFTFLSLHTVWKK